MPLNIATNCSWSIVDYIFWASSYKTNFSIMRLARQAFKVNALKVFIAFLFFIARRPKKWTQVLIDEFLIRFIGKTLIFLFSLGKNPVIRSKLIFKLSQFFDLVHLRGLTFAVKTRVKSMMGISLF